jgi:hypothetical protein
MLQDDKIPAKPYNPKPEDRAKVEFVYDRLTVLLDDVMGKSYPEMNDRTPKQLWDDSQKRLNAYVRTKAAQGKEEWQANLFTGSTRNKQRSYVGSSSREVPLISISATSESGERSRERAEWLKGAVRHSYVQGDNPEMVIFEDGWNCSGNGTVIKHDCYVRQYGKTETVTGWDPETGEVEYETKDVDDAIGRYEEVDVPLERLIPGDAYKPTQDQTELIWYDYYDKAQFTAEFGKYANFKHVQPGGGHVNGDQDLFFGKKWGERTEKDKYEVVKYYSKRLLEKGKDGKEALRSCYRIVVNGVLMLDAPLLWGGKRKRYPLAVAQFEPFAKKMFWGNSLPNIVMAMQDEENSLENSLLDKVHRSVETPMLVGNVNRDDLELEDRLVTGSDRIYVQDVEKVKPMPVAGPTQGEFAMLDRVGKMLSEATVDALQGGAAGSGSTAREVVLANERANDMKGIFFLMLKDLWLQKTRLRVDSIIANYTRQDSAGRYRAMNVPDAELSDGSKGVLKLKVATEGEIAEMNRTAGYDETGRRFNMTDVSDEADSMREGVRVETLAIPPGYLDGYEYEIEIQTESLKQRGKGIDMALATEFATTAAQLFPAKFAANEDKFFSELAKQYGQNPAVFDGALPAPAAPVQMPGQSPAPGPATAMMGAGAKPLPEMGALI